MNITNFLDELGLQYYNDRLLAYLRSLPSQGETGVHSFNGRDGDVVPQSGDYTPSMVGAVPVSRTVNGKALSSNITLTASDVGAQPNGSYVPTSRTINGKALNSDITLTASDVGTRPIIIGNYTGSGTDSFNIAMESLPRFFVINGEDSINYSTYCYGGLYLGWPMSYTNMSSGIIWNINGDGSVMSIRSNTRSYDSTNKKVLFSGAEELNKSAIKYYWLAIN